MPEEPVPEEPVPEEPVSEDPLAATAPTASSLLTNSSAHQIAQGQQVVVTFFINDSPQDQLIIRRSAIDPAVFFVEAEPFLELIEDELRFDVREALELAVDPSGYLSSEALRQNGLELVFDDRRLELYLRIPVELRRLESDYSDGSLPPEVAAALQPSQVSGYLNLRGTQELSWPDERNSDLRRQPLRIGFEGALNLEGWVLEGSGNFTEGRNPNISRNDVRLVHDVPTQALRYVVGDLNIPITGYQSNLPMAGIAIARNFSLQPYRVVRPLNQFQFLLERPSRVEVYLNGALIQTLRLPAGVQDIRNLSLNEGINNLQLIITDDLGEVTRIDFSTGLSRNLLGAGLEQFVYGLGFPSSRTGQGYTYDWQNPVLNLAHRWGINNNLTTGTYFQGDLRHQLLGWEGIWANQLGNIEWDAALSHDPESQVDYAFRLRYDYIRNGRTNPSQRQLGFLVTYEGENFAPLDPFAASGQTSFTFGVDYREELMWGIFSNLNASYSLGREDTPDSYNLLLGFNKFFTNGISFNLNLSHSQDQWGEQEQRVLINLSWLFPQQRQTLSTSTGITSNGQPNYQVNWNIASPASFRGIDTTLLASQNSSARTVNTRLRYRGYRGNLNVAHDLRLPTPRPSSVSSFSQFFGGSGPINTTRLNFETAVVFADGIFGWSRPVTNSFAIVVPDGNLAGQHIGVNPQLNSYTAQIDGMGPAVLPELQPYRLSTLRVTPTDSDPNYSLSQELFRVFPSYRSGTLVRLQSVLPVTLEGQLLFADQTPIASQAGAVVSTSGALARPLMFTTDETGFISIPGLKPGQYEVRLFTYNEDIAEIIIPAGHSGLYNFGRLVTTPTYEDEDEEEGEEEVGTSSQAGA
jgi:outer membrane usher protein